MNYLKTFELFDLGYRIILYDLTNTYFEGTKDIANWLNMDAAKKSAAMLNW